MKIKKGFTLIELSLLIFVMLVIMAIVLPLSFSNTKESYLITKWERIFEEVKYSFSVYSLNNRNVFDIKSMPNYLSIDKTRLNDPILSKYSYSFLNGKSVKENSRYYVDKFYFLEDSTIMGVKMADTCKMGQTCGIIIFDVNGEIGPNKFGKDVFGVNVYIDRVEAFGTNLSNKLLASDCNKSSSGVFCSFYYLLGGKLN